jgi:hypothetical protein
MAEKIIYCPYTDQELPESKTSLEHIIPLSLGGNDRFVIPVNSDFNQKVGSEIDGRLANELLILKKRAEYDARGHSGKAPEPVVKKATDLETGRPLQVTMGSELKIWDSIDRKETSPYNRKFEATVTVDLDLPLRFLAKAALSAGYFVYGDLFRKHVDHKELRMIMKGPLSLTEEENRSIKTKVFNPYSDGSELSQTALEEFRIQKFICEKIIKGGCVVFLRGRNNIGVFGSVLNNYLGLLNVPAVTKNFPHTDLHEMGHAIILSNGTVVRLSYRQLLMRVQEEIQKSNSAKKETPE